MIDNVGVPELAVSLLIALVLLGVVWPATRVCQRVGLPRWLGVLAVVPLANVGLLWYVALVKWPLTGSPLRA
jgi:predicted PurR-regulated permease PerM